MAEESATSGKTIFTPFNIVAGIILAVGAVLTILRFTGGLAAGSLTGNCEFLGSNGQNSDLTLNNIAALTSAPATITVSNALTT